MQLVLLLLQLEIDPAADAVRAPCGPLLEDLTHAQHARLARDEDVEVAAEAVLERGRLEELLHELLRVNAALEVDRELEAVQIRLVAHVGDLADLAGLDELRDLVDDDLGRSRVGDLIDLNEIPFPDVAPAGAAAEAAAAGIVNLQHLRRVVEDFAAGREIRRGQQLKQVCAGIFDQSDGRLADLAQIERADVRRHADCDAHVRVDEHVRERGGKKRRLLHGGVVVVDEVNGVGVDVAEQLLTDRFELRLGIPGRGAGHVARVDLAEVALRVDEWVQQRLVAAREAHHRVVDGGVAVRIQLHRLADDVGRLRARFGQQTHLIHRVEQLAVRGLEAVDLRDRARHDDRHRVGHVVFFECAADRLLLHLGPQAHHIRVVFMMRFFVVLLFWHDV